ncbi:MAG: serine/threonine-protein kinase [Pseudomonadota bacterium]
MSDDHAIDWRAIGADVDTSPGQLARVRRVVDLFDRLNLPRADAIEDTFHWGSLEVFEALASGSFGTVYRAWDPHLQREVALKLLPAHAPGASDWLNEARRLARVRHPNVVAILGADMHDNCAGIWMELSDGQSLESVLASGQTLPEAAVLELAKALAAALAAIHERGLVHGDLKAANVLIEADGRVLLLDFGSAAESTDIEPARTGSPLSAAPEVLAGDTLTAAADLYGLGVLLYRCLAGCYPFMGDDVAELIRNQVDPPDLSPIPRNHRPLLAALLDRTASDRLDPDDVLNQLQAIEDAPSQRRRRRAVGGVIAGLSLGVLIAVAGWWQTHTAREAEQRAAHEARASLQFFQDVVGASFEGTHGQDARIIDVLEQSQRQLALDDSQPPYVRAMVQFVVGSSYLDLGRADEGMALLDDSLALLASEDVNVPQSAAQVLVEQGMEWCDQDADKAEEAATRLRSIATGRLAPDHRAFLGALVIESCAAQRRGNDVLAEEKLLAAMALRPLDEFPADLSAIRVAGRMSNLLVSMGRLTEATPLLEDVHSRSVALLGRSHNTSLGAAASLGEAYVQSSRYDEAVSLLEATVAEVEERRGTTSRQWIMTATALATALGRAGESERALFMLEQVLSVATEQVGATHMFTLGIRTNRANRLFELNRLEEAEAAMAETAALIESELGAGQQFAIMNRLNRLEVLVMLDRVPEAVELGRRTLATSLESLGPNHGLTASLRGYLANALTLQGEFGEAEAMFLGALEFRDRSNPTANATFETRHRFATMLADQGRMDELRRELMALEPAFDALPPDHPLLQQIEELGQRLR